MRDKLAVALLLSGCSIHHIPDLPVIGYYERNIGWVITETPEVACDAAYGKEIVRTRNACAVLVDDNCLIFTKPVRNEEDRAMMAVLGHEVLHCFVGEYHY